MFKQLRSKNDSLGNLYEKYLPKGTTLDLVQGIQNVNQLLQEIEEDLKYESLPTRTEDVRNLCKGILGEYELVLSKKKDIIRQIVDSYNNFLPAKSEFKQILDKIDSHIVLKL